jgi:hypothetical protein
MTTIGQFGILLLLVSFAAGEQADDKGVNWGVQRWEWIMQQFESTDFIAADRRLWREWSMTEHTLLTILQRTDSDHTRRLIIARLGDMRSAQADLPLIKRITLEGPQLLSLDDPLVRYPAAGTLVKIGLPAVRTILRDRVGTPATEEELTLFAKVIHGHYVLENSVGRFHIESELQKAQEPPKGKLVDSSWEIRKRNLAKLLEIYDSLDRSGQIVK